MPVVRALVESELLARFCPTCFNLECGRQEVTLLPKASVYLLVAGESSTLLDRFSRLAFRAVEEKSYPFDILILASWLPANGQEWLKRGEKLPSAEAMASVLDAFCPTVLRLPFTLNHLTDILDESTLGQNASLSNLHKRVRNNNDLWIALSAIRKLFDAQVVDELQAIAVQCSSDRRGAVHALEQLNLSPARDLGQAAVQRTTEDAQVQWWVYWMWQQLGQLGNMPRTFAVVQDAGLILTTTITRLCGIFSILMGEKP